jgi:error-prone DNA polymerase
MLERVSAAHGYRWFCNVCAHDWEKDANGGGARASGRVDASACASGDLPAARFRSLDHLIDLAGLRRDELVTLAEIGALNSFGYDRRSALWQIERAVRPAGELFEDSDQEPGAGDRELSAGSAPLRPMTSAERVIADYDGTGLTIGPHPMALRRRELALRGVLRAIDLPQARNGRRVRVAGSVITRQRPGTAKGFVFLTLEDETGISNVIVEPHVFSGQRRAIVGEPFVIVEGVLQLQDGVTSVRAERVVPLTGRGPAVESHDFR